MEPGLLDFVREARSLAQSCWIQCKDSASPSRSIAGSLRALRNTLEEIEEIYEGNEDPTTRDSDISQLVESARDCLRRLGPIIQNSTPCEPSDLLEDIQKSVDASNRDLTAVLTASGAKAPSPVSHGDPRSRQTSWDAETPTTVGEDASVEKSSRVSHPSAAGLPVSAAIKTDSEPFPQEKQAIADDPLPIVLSESATSDTLTPYSDWRSPFASPDPMSISIERASTLILSPAPELSPSGTGRARSPTITVDPPAPPPHPRLITGHTASPEGFENNDLPGVPVPYTLESRAVATNNGTGSKPRSTYVRRHSEVTHLSPLSAGPESVLRHRAYSDAADPARPAELRRSHTGSVNSGLGITFGLPMQSPRGPDPGPLESQPSPAVCGEITAPDDSRNIADSSPPMPMRRPPPPPPSPRKQVRVRTSSYRIVNAAPGDGSSSDEEPPPPVRSPRLSSSIEISEGLAYPSTASPPPSVLQPNERQVSNDVPGPIDTRSTCSPEEAVQTGEKSIGVQPTISVPPPALPNNPPPLPPKPRRFRSSITELNTSKEVSSEHLRSKSNPNIRAISSDLSDKEALSTEMTSPPSMTGRAETLPETVPETGLEVNSNPNVTPPEDSGIADVPAGRVPSPQSSKEESIPSTSTAASTITPTVTEWYGSPGETPSSDLETERINHIVHFFNQQEWTLAEAYLTDYLATLSEAKDLARARRVLHLLGVCASFKGEWARALPFFLSAIRKPISSLEDLDDGDCAAAYWLGDIYAMQNARTEALLAYLIAERSSVFQRAREASLATLIALEQEAVQLGAPRSDFKLRWAQIAFQPTNDSNPDSILDPRVVTVNAAKLLFDSRAAKVAGKRNVLHPDRQRSHSLLTFVANISLRKLGDFHKTTISAPDFLPDSTWPMMYDPYFAMANLRSSRLMRVEGDLVQAYCTNSTAKVPKSSSVALYKAESFTSSDLPWLIEAVRECLRVYEMEWSESVVASMFLVRYSFLQDKIATTYYFSIHLFKQAMRSGYTLDICPDGIVSARLLRTSHGYERGVHYTESKRIKKLIHEYLEQADRQREKPGMFRSRT